MTVRVFGYGSLVWRPDFEAEASWPGRVHGWARRFWQGSPDHRGTPEAPGRVATLVPDPAAVTVGRVYVLPDATAEAVLARLDHRERAGFARDLLEVWPLDGGPPATAVTWRATADNPWYLGPAPPDAVAARVRASAGPSGTNLEYVLALHAALSALDAVDDHLADVVAALARAP